MDYVIILNKALTKLKKKLKEKCDILYAVKRNNVKIKVQQLIQMSQSGND